MSTSPNTPSHPTPAARRPVSPAAVAVVLVAAVLVAATATGLLIATAADQPAREPANTGSGPGATPSASAARVPGASLAAAAPAATAAPIVAAPPTAATAAPIVAAPPAAATGTPVGGTGRPRPAGPDDVDGDGRRDTVSVPAPGTLRIRYAIGTTDTVTFDAAGDDGGLLGIVDADRDGRAEVFVHAGRGAYTDQTSVLRYVGGRLRLVTFDGTQVRLVSGASVRNSTSWACRPPAAPIVQWSGESEDGTAYRGTLVSYRFSGATLLRLSSRTLTVDERTPAPSGCGHLRT